MKRQETASLIVCFTLVMVLLIYGFLLLGAAPSRPGEPVTAPAAPSPTSLDRLQPDLEEVRITLPEELPEELPDRPDASPVPSKPDAGSLATRQEGMQESPGERRQHDSEPPVTTAREDENSVSDADTTVDQADAPEARLEEDVQASESIVAELPSADASQGDEGEGLETQLTLQGNIPPMIYSGRTDRLFELFPRLEMVWVRDREPREGRPAVILEFVLEPQGGLQWKDIIRPTQNSPGYAFATRSYITTDCVQARNPEKLNIWNHRQEILARSELTDPHAPRLRWGHYRHRVEQYLLQPVLAAFQKMQQAGEFAFVPQEQATLEVVWDTDSEGRPYAKTARFLAAGKPPVELSLPPRNGPGR